MNILYAIDDNYINVLAVSLLSLFENNKNNTLNVTILVKKLNNDNEEMIKEIAKKYDRTLKIIKDDKIDDLFISYGIKKYHGSYSAYYRLLFDRYFNENYYVLYLDADTIIVNNIATLQNIDLKDNYIAAVKEPQGKYYSELIGLKEYDYFNSGILLLNTKKWKQDNCREKVINSIKNKNFYVYPDQDIINITFKEKIMVLDPTYNYMPIHRICSENCYDKVFGLDKYYSTEKLTKARQYPIVIHCYSFLGESPWMKNNIHPDKQLFNYYFQKTGCINNISSKSKFNFLYLIEKILIKILPENFFFKIYKKISIKSLKKIINKCEKKGL